MCSAVCSYQGPRRVNGQNGSSPLCGERCLSSDYARRLQPWQNQMASLEGLSISQAKNVDLKNHNYEDYVTFESLLSQGLEMIQGTYLAGQES